jgi:hypothetical protein
MIACYPLEPDVPFTPAPVEQSKPPPGTRMSPPPAKGFFEGETTECNYIVLIFVLGVLLLAFTDAMKR